MLNTTSAKTCLNTKIAPERDVTLLPLAALFTDYDVYDLVSNHMAEFGTYRAYAERVYEALRDALTAYNEDTDEPKTIPTRDEFKAAFLALCKKLKVAPSKVVIVRF